MPKKANKKKTAKKVAKVDPEIDYIDKSSPMTELENNHIRFGDCPGGHSPQHHKIISPASPIDALVGNKPTTTLFGGQREG